MQKRLNKTDVKPAKASTEAAGVQVKSVSSTGNIKIALKPTAVGEASATAADVKSGQSATSQVAKADQPKAGAATSASANSKKNDAKVVATTSVKTAAGRAAAKNVVGKPAVAKSSAKVSKPSAGMTPKSLASASAQSDAAFALAEKSARSSSLKPMGLAAAALGVLALGLGVLQFAGGKSEATAQADVSAGSEASVLAETEATPKAAPVEIAAVEPKLTSQPVAEQTAADPKISQVEPVSASILEPVANEVEKVAVKPLEVPVQDVVAQVVTPQVDPDKAAIVAPISAAHKNVVVAEASDDLMQGAIAAAISKLSSQPKAVAEPVEAAVVIPEAPAVDETNEAAPETEVALVTGAVEDAGAHVSTAQKLLLVSYLSALPDKASDQDAELVARMTSGTLAALSAPQTTVPDAAVEPVYIFDLVVKALADGLSEAEVDVALNEAYAAGQVTVPSSLVLADGRVDSQTILALFASK